MVPLGSKEQHFLPMSEELIKYSHGICGAGENEFLRKIEEAVANHPLRILMGAKEVTKTLQLLCKMLQAAVVIEVGVFVGYTTLALALALPDDGKVYGLDISAEFADIGKSKRKLSFCLRKINLRFSKEYWKESQMMHKIDLRIGPAIDTLGTLQTELFEKVDLIFIDADKPNYVSYLTLCQNLLRPGGLIVLDNTLWFGKVISSEPASPRTEGIRRANKHVKMMLDPLKWDAVTLPFADGVTLLLKLPNKN